MHKKNLVKIVITAAVLFLTACSSAPRFTSSKAKSEKQDEENAKIKTEDLNSYNNYAVLETVTGVASYYADKYHGHTTSNGETYNMYGLTAAHPTYHHNTVIRVTNLSNNKTVTIRINDRMPPRPDRIIDLSYGAALAIDMINDGITKVKLEILEWGKD